MKLALIDGDILVYRIGFATQKTIKILTDEDGNLLGEFKTKKELDAFCEDIKYDNFECTERVDYEPFSNAVYLVKSLINSILKGTGCSQYRIFLSNGPCFRDKLAITKPYKGNRDNIGKPHHYYTIRDLLIDEYGATYKYLHEADDLLSIHSLWGDNSTVICSNDKDLNQIPGDHFDWTRDGLYTISNEGAIRNFWKQMLTGDATDNIMGLPRVGPVRANAIVNNLEAKDLALQVRRHYEEYWPADATDKYIENIILLRLLGCDMFIKTPVDEQVKELIDQVLKKK